MILHFNSTEQFQNLKRIYFVTLNRNRFQAAGDHSFNVFDNFIKSYKFRIGSRSFQVVANEEQGTIAYTQTLLSLGGLHKQKTTEIEFSTFPRTQNIHSFDFEKVLDEAHSGEDSQPKPVRSVLLPIFYKDDEHQQQRNCNNRINLSTRTFTVKYFNSI